MSVSDGAYGAGDSGTLDSGASPSLDSGADAVAVVPQTRAMLAVNASPDLDDIRLCVAAGGGGPTRWITNYAIPDDVNAPMPQSNYPGIPRGGGVVLPAIRELGRGSVTVFAVRASMIIHDVPGSANARQCGDLICATSAAGCLNANAEYFQLPDVGPVPLADGSYLLAVTGCIPSLFDPAGSVARCGPQYTPAGGNLGVTTAKLDTSAHADPNQMGAQVAQLAPGIDDAFLPDGGSDAGVTVGYGPLGVDDAGAPLASSLRYLGVSALVSREVPSAMTEGLFASVGVTVSVDGRATPALALTLAGIQKLSDPTELPDQFFKGQTSYLFAIVGDPTAPQQLTAPDGGLNASYDGHGLHVIALPTTLDDGTL